MSDQFGADDKEHSRENLVMVPAAQVEIGMFVAELDRPWIETPFLLQGFEVRTRSQLDTLMDFCRHVYVLKENPEQAKKRQALKLEPLPIKVSGPVENKVARKSIGNLLPGARVRRSERKPPERRSVQRLREPYEASTPVRLEHSNARKALEAGRVGIKSLLASARLGQMLDTDIAEEAVEGCVQSILANPEALLWMSRIKDKNQYTAEHCMNVCVLAIAFGRHLRMAEPELRLLGLCGLLHDVGKMRIPMEVLDKPGRLTLDEFEIIKTHTTRGAELLQQQVPRPDPEVIEVAQRHHERPDGGGYPGGLNEAQLSEFSRIISIVDAYDAITSNRCYSPEQPSTEAQRIIFQNRGGQFDEEFALQFIRAIGPYPPGTLVELQNGLMGLVLAGKPKFRHLPTVLVLRDTDGNPTEEQAVDLSLTDTGALSKDFLVKRTHPDGSFGLSVRDYQVKAEPDFL
ncbi:MAG TPA: HD-GYP domain-containing protein [Porticoccaceae bacterium]|nr:HD-GYP domain-containing protein [Porticoccaceae bacterium]